MKKNGKFLVEIIIVGENQHKHIFKRTSDLYLDFKEKITDEEIEVNIEPKDLYEVPQNIIIAFLSLLIKGIAQHFIVVINQEGKPIKETKPAVSGKVLKVARDWKGLDQALKDSFTSRFPIPRIGLIAIIALGIIVVMVLIWKGIIPIPTNWKGFT